MNIVVLFDRVKNKIVHAYRNYVFGKYVKCSHNDYNVVGKVILINRNIKLGRNVTIYPDVCFWGDGPINIGDNVDIGNGTIIYSSKNGGVTVGNDTLIAAQCYIIDMDHGIEAKKLIRMQDNNVEAIKIGNDVWIAAGCKILRGSRIENGAVIGANSLVKGIVPSGMVAVGSPAKAIKKRK